MKKLFGKLWQSAIVLTIVTAILITVLSAGLSVAIAAPSDVFANFNNRNDQSKYPKPDFSDITGEGHNPPELTGMASSLGMEKMWYEYITYSEKPVGQFNLSSTQRVVYYDPYDYNSALVMRVKDEITDWSTANEVSFTYETVESHVIRTDTTNETSTIIGTDSTSGGGSSTTNSTAWDTTSGWVQEIGTETQTGTTAEAGFSFGAEVSTKVTAGVEAGYEAGWSQGAVALVSGKVSSSVETGVSATASTFGSLQTHSLTSQINTASTSFSTSNSQSYDESNEETWSLSQKFEKATGVSTSNGDEWSTSNSRSITTTYLAQYFNEEGSPLSWKIVQYAVFMPMRYELQTRIDGEWLTVYNGYSLITPIQGTCRAYMRNNVAYIEDWGTGLPIPWADFWSSFYTTQSLKEAYENNLYPES